MMRNDEMDNFAEKEESVATRYCIEVSGSKSVDCVSAPAEVNSLQP